MSASFIDVISELVYDKLKTADDSCRDECVYFPRVCVGCVAPSTHAYAACGHAVCRDCAVDSCPECGKRSNAVKFDDSLFRGCGVCRRAYNPRFRDVYITCGHIVCSGCSVVHDFSPLANHCPLCLAASRRFSLVEKSDSIPANAYPTVDRGSDLFDEAIAQFEHVQLQKELSEREEQQRKDEQERVALELQEKQEMEAKLLERLKKAQEKLQKKKDQQVFEDRLKWALEQRKVEEKKRQEEEQLRIIQENQKYIQHWEAAEYNDHYGFEDHKLHQHHHYPFVRNEIVYYMH